MRSVQNQTYGNIEHIVQDGGSTDGTLDEIRRLAGPTTDLVSESDEGIYDAINRGIRRATGDIVGFMHSDDFFANENALSSVAQALEHRSVDGVYADLQYVSAGDPTQVIRDWKAGAYGPASLKRGWMPPHPTLYLRREVYEQFGLYDTKLRIAADYEAILRYLVKGQIRLAYIPEVLVMMRTGGESNRSLKLILQKSREDLIAMERYNLGGAGVLALKNLRKVKQFLVKRR